MTIFNLVLKLYYSQRHMQYITMNTDSHDTYWVFELVATIVSKYLSSIFQHHTSEETWLSTFHSPINPSTILGGFQGNNFTEVYYETVEPTIPTIFQRTKAICFAYGQTDAVCEACFNNALPTTLCYKISGSSPNKQEAWSLFFVIPEASSNDHGNENGMTRDSWEQMHTWLDLRNCCTSQVYRYDFVELMILWLYY